MDLPIADLIAHQSGVIARRQLLALGSSDPDIRCRLKRREFRRILPGVFIDHTGPPTWQQRAWAAVLYADGVLCGPSALRAAHGPGNRYDSEDLIHVAIPAQRRVRSQEGIRIVRRRNLRAMALANTSPPRQRYEDAALDVALASDRDTEALAVLAAACQGRRTTARRLANSLAHRSRAPRRVWLRAVLKDIAEGSCSVLEHEYLTKVERAHGLPSGLRQEKATATVGIIYRDLVYDDLVLELDGRPHHDSAEARDRDMERDLDAALIGMGTLRLGWRQVHDRPCRTAGKVGDLLTQRGWRGSPHRCGPHCRIVETFGAYSTEMFHDRPAT